MSTLEEEVTKEQEVTKEISQESAKETPTGRTKTKAVRPGSSTKETARPVKAKFKAGKDL